MTFFKQCLVTLTFIVIISVWVIPTDAAVDINQLRTCCTALVTTVFNDFSFSSGSKLENQLKGVVESSSTIKDNGDNQLKENINNINSAVNENWCNDLVAEIKSKDDRIKVARNVINLFNNCTEIGGDGKMKNVSSFCDVKITMSTFKPFLEDIFKINT